MSASIEDFCNKCPWRFRCPFDWDKIRDQHAKGIYERFEARGRTSKRVRWLDNFKCAKLHFVEEMPEHIKISIKLKKDFIIKLDERLSCRPA